MPSSTRAIGCLLLPGFPLRALGAWTDGLAALNAQQSEVLYTLTALAPEPGPVPAHTGVAVQARPPDATDRWHAVAVIGGDPLPEDRRLIPLLQSWDREGVILGGLGSGAAALALAGLLDGQRACADWLWLDRLAAAYPAVAWSQGLWDLSLPRRRFSATATAAADLVGAWAQQLHGEPVQQEWMLAMDLRQGRPADERQRRERLEARDVANPKLAEALSLMEANLAEPLPTEEVARLVGVSRRQLERLFKQHLDSLPSRHYLSLRLERAQHLLQRGTQSILQVGLSCGFASGPHFSNAYKAHHGHTPREERSRRAGWPTHVSQGDIT